MINKFKKTTFILIFILFTCINAFSQTATYRLGIAYGNSLYSNKKQFEFTLDSGQKVTLNSTNPIVYFNRQFAAGQSYRFTQAPGQSCNLKGINQGIFNNQDIVVSIDCGNPPLSIFKLQLSGVEQGEIFKFADNYGRTHQYSVSTLANLGGFPIRDDYNITQTGGPRQCRMTKNQGVVPYTNLIVIADCSKTATGNPTPSPTVTPTPPPTKTFSEVDLVSRSTDNKSFGTFYDSGAVVIGGIGADEGRYVAFVSSAAGLGGSLGKKRQIIWRDRKTGETKMVSATATGGEGNGDSFVPAMSADGKSVAFESYATNLVPIDNNKVRDVFVWNFDNNTVTAVSENRGIEANSECFEPTISADGNLIAFSSSASNLTTGVDGISTVNVFLRDLRSGAVTLISKHDKTGKGGGGSRPSISEDGSRIAFYNYFPLTEEDKNNLWDIYIWESGNPKLKRISKTVEGMDKNQGDESSSRIIAPSLSGNGKYIAYSTTATNMVGGDTNKLQDVFVVEIDSGRVSRASVGADGAEGNGDSPIGQGEKIAISYDGNWVAFSTKATNLGGNILMRNWTNNQTVPISAETGSTISQPVMSRNGGYLVFGTSRQLDNRYKSSGIFAYSTGLK